MTSPETKRKAAALNVKASEKKMLNTIGLFEVACQTANTNEILTKREELHNILDSYLDFINEVYYLDLQNYWKEDDY